MADEKQSTQQASAAIHQSLPLVKNAFHRLLTELREAGQKTGGQIWPQIEPAVNKLEASVTNFFAKPEAVSPGEVTRTITQQIDNLREVCLRTNAVGIAPFGAAAQAMMGQFLQEWEFAHDG